MGGLQSRRFSFDQRQIDFILTILIDNIRLRSIRDKPSRSLNQHSKRKQAEQPKPRVCPFNEYVNNEKQGFQARISRRKDGTEETGEYHSTVMGSHHVVCQNDSFSRRRKGEIARGRRGEERVCCLCGSRRLCWLTRQVSCAQV